MLAVSATPEAVEAIERLRERHGSIVLHQSGGCCAGSSPMCLGAEELPAGPNDIEIGVVAGVPVLIDRDLFARWGGPDFCIDVAPGAADSLSLEGSDGVHFVNATP
jgi:hypothetical protein